MKHNSTALLRCIPPISIFLSFVVALAVFGVQQGTPTPTPTPVPCEDAWSATDTTNAPEARFIHTAVWTGSEMIVWGGGVGSGVTNTGGRYDPVTDTWTATSTTDAPAARSLHTAVWTGSEMIVWGGQGTSGFLNTGGRYDPATDTWTAISTTDAPVARYEHTAVWTGSEMIVWGGLDSGGVVNTGGRYNPVTDTWTAISTTNAPAARFIHTAVWTGSEMIVWGGNGGSDFDTGGRYDPVTDTWTATSTTNAPAARYAHAAVWTGSEMIVWSGLTGTSSLNTGGRYDPVTDTWTATSTMNAPAARFYPTAVWTGSEMIAWGGHNISFYFNNGGRYDPATDTWAAITMTNAPAARRQHTAVWTGSQMIVWGGTPGGNTRFNTGGRYCGQLPAPSPTPTATPTATPVNVQMLNISGRIFVQTGDTVGFAGFIFQGGTSKRVLIRAIGPSLNVSGNSIASALQNPFLELRDGNGILLNSNDNWRTGGQETEIEQSGLAPADDRESALIATLGPATYTGVIRGVNDTVGIATIEIYDLQATAPGELANLSVRGDVRTDDDVLIAGLILQGGTPKRVMFRAIGPSLGGKGVSGALQDPTLALHNGNGSLVLSNDNWQQAPNAAEIQSSGLAPTDGRESAILMTVVPDSYTGIVRGVDRTTGIALAEAYKLD
jgi:N-acetylneuraminic acid mutarotase